MTAASAALRVCRLRPDVDGDVPLPRAMSAEAAGLDVCAALSGPLVLEPGERAAVPTGFALGVPPGWEVQIRPRSGLAIRHGITLINSPGTVDSDYRGEVMVLLVNHGRDRFTVQRGMRIAQLVVARLAPISVLEVDSLDATARGAGGFGSTGVDSADPAEA